MPMFKRNVNGLMRVTESVFALVAVNGVLRRYQASLYQWYKAERILQCYQLGWYRRICLILSLEFISRDSFYL